MAELITVSLVEQVDQAAAVLQDSAEIQAAQETLLPLLHLKGITEVLELLDSVLMVLAEAVVVPRL